MMLEIVLGVALVVAIVWAAVATTMACGHANDTDYFRDLYFRKLDFEQRAIEAETRLESFYALGETRTLRKLFIPPPTTAGD